jgi:hypothetical protein
MAMDTTTTRIKADNRPNSIMAFLKALWSVLMNSAASGVKIRMRRTEAIRATMRNPDGVKDLHQHEDEEEAIHDLDRVRSQLANLDSLEEGPGRGDEQEDRRGCQQPSGDQIDASLSQSEPAEESIALVIDFSQQVSLFLHGSSPPSPHSAYRDRHRESQN